VRVVNAHSDPDLFWALQGGGGGSWGVVTRVTLRTHTLPANFGVGLGRVRAANDDAFRRLLARFCAFYAERLFNPHWGEQFSVGDDNSLKLSMVCQGLTPDEVRATWQPFFDWVNAAGPDYTWVDQPRADAWDARGWWRVTPGRKSMIADPRPGAPAHHGWWKGDQDQVGAFLYGYESLWLPAMLLASGEQPRLVDALYAASRHKTVDVHCNKGLAGGPEAAVAATRRTATNPAACDAFALAIIADGEGPAYPGLERPPVDEAKARRVAQSIDAATAELRAVAPAGGSYVSESNYFNARWAEAFWGESYARLKAVKAKYDPEGLFYVHHGVGSEEWAEGGFERVKPSES
ncbi:MAG: binding domain protein, partial [Verrucomicrobia bacterium]|nr:binding domain protein [Verrucomicrobiota bacterium]